MNDKKGKEYKYYFRVPFVLEIQDKDSRYEDETPFYTDGNTGLNKLALEKAVKDWNESNMEQYFDLKLINGNLPEKIIMSANKRYDPFAYVTFYFSSPCSKLDMTEIENWLTGQMSDGWGEGFEQQEQVYEKTAYYIHFWWARSNPDISVYYSVVHIEPNGTVYSEE